jgi:two-component system, sensor histidine kinase PdtaS
MNSTFAYFNTYSVKLITSLLLLSISSFSNASSVAKDSTYVLQLEKKGEAFWYKSPDSSIMVATEMKSISEEIGFINGQIGALNILGVAYKIKGKLDESIACYLKAETICLENKILKKLSAIYGNIGEVYRVQGKYTQALAYQLKSLKIDKEIGNLKSESIVYNNIGAIYANIGKYDEAIKFHLLSLRLKIKIKNKYGAAVSLSNIGSVYLDKEDLDNALKFTQKGLDMAINMNEGNLAADASATMGNIYLRKAKKEQSTNASSFGLASLDYALKTDYIEGAAYTYNDIGQTFLYQKKYAEAEKNFNKALALGKDNSWSEIQILALDGLTKTYKEQGNSNKALESYEAFVSINDSINNIDAAEDLLKTRLDFEFENERALAEQEKQAEITKRNLISIGLGLILLLLAVVLYLIYRRSQFIKERQLETQKNLEEKEALLREIHHRVKNNLAVISGLLYLQKNRVSDEQIKAVLSEGQNRIDSMVLVHEMLYQSQNIAAIDMQSYLNKLVQQIAAGFEEKQLKYTIQGTYTLETKQAIPIGLILTELITNIYKYAYPNQQQGIFSLHIEDAGDNNMKLILKDSGIGLPEDFKVEKSKSLGLKLVKLLSQQLGANLQFFNDNGVRVEINCVVKKGEALI